MAEKYNSDKPVAHNERLRNIAVRLARLKPASSQEYTPLNFSVGALFALIRAEQLKYPSQRHYSGRGRRMWEKAKGLCSKIERGEQLLERGDWFAGFFFNDAIVRIDVAFEHIVRHSIKLYGHIEHRKLIDQAGRHGFKKEWADSWSPVHKEVNRLKHENRKYADGPQLTYNKAIQALDDLCFALRWGIKHGN
jgi:hypothetical protein